jgi:hypothetical protein
VVKEPAVAIEMCSYIYTKAASMETEETTAVFYCLSTNNARKRNKPF